MLDITNADQVNDLLSALAEQLASAGCHRELVIIGGSALVALGIISRPTQDVDVVAFLTQGVITKADPFPDDVIAARGRVSRDFGLREDWLNPGPAGLVDLGLPEGFVDRVETRTFGPGLTAHFASRIDQIHFKLYALVDQGVGKHEQDLRALEPTADELVRAARWTRTHDPSVGFHRMLEEALRYLGVEDADLGA